MKKFKTLFISIFVLFTFIMYASCTTKYKIKIDYNKEYGTVYINDNNSSGEYSKDSKIKITVSPKEGFYVETFKVNDKVIENNEYEFTIKNDIDVLVVFKEIYYNINLEFNNQLGNVTLEPSNTSFKYGELVKINVIPNEDVQVQSVSINDNACTLNENNQYEFTIKSDSNIKVEFVDNKQEILQMTDEILNSIKGQVKFDGVYFYDETGDDYDTANAVSIIFGNNAIHQIESDLIYGTVYYNELYINQNDLLVKVVRNIDNEMEYYESEDAFVDFYNPFNYLKAEDFRYVGENTFELIDKELAKKVATALSGWEESIEKFTITVDEEGKIILVSFDTCEINLFDDLSYYSSYEFDVLDHGTADIDHTLLKPYEREESHNELELALQNAEKATNYKIRHLDVEVGYEDVDYNVYVTESAIYSDCIGWEGGYVLKGNYIYPYSYIVEENKAILEDAIVDNKTMEDIQAIFTGFKVELFESKGDGVFVLRDAEFASTIAQYFAEGFDEMKQYSFATDLTVTIKDGVLYQVAFGYSTYGITAHVTLTYSDFDNTTLPISLDNYEQVSILDGFIGSYRDDNGHFAIIDKSGIILNGEEFIVASYDSENDVIIGYYNEEIYYINKYTSTQLFISNDALTVTYSLKSVYKEDVTIDPSYKGVWENENHSLVVQSHVVRYDGKELELLSFNEYEGIIALDENIMYSFSLNEQSMLVIVIENDIISENYNLEKTNKPIGVEIPDEYVGVYQTKDDSNLTIVITYSDITINNIPFEIELFTTSTGFVGKYNGIDNYTIIVSSFTNEFIYVGTSSRNYTAYRIETVKPHYIGVWESILEDSNYIVILTEYSISINGTLIEFTYDLEYGYTGMYNNETVYLKHTLSSVNGKDILVLYSETLAVVLESTENIAINIPEAYVGNYQGELEGITYLIDITSTGIVVTIGNNEPIKAVITDYNDKEGFTIKLGDVEYRIRGVLSSALLSMVTFSTHDYSTKVVCDRTGFGIIVPDKFHGTYIGEEDGVTYVVEISAGSIIITIGDNAPCEVVIKVYDQYEGFTVELNGVEYYILDITYTEPIVDIMIMSADYELTVKCTKN